MKIESIREEDSIRLKVIGRVDANTSEDLQHEVLLSFQKSNKVILDFEEVDYISSAGLRALLIGQKTADSKNAGMTLCHVCDDVLDILKMTGFDEVITILQEAD